MSIKKHILKLSGGKDSEACLWWCYDNLPFDRWDVTYNDTEWESPLLYQHLKYLESRTGKTFLSLRNNQFTEKIPQEILEAIEKIFGHASVFAEMVWFKKRFPSTKARFCTEFLKVYPSIDYILENLHEDIVVVQGVRAQESRARRNLAPTDEYFKFYFEPYAKDKNGKELFHTYRKDDIFKHCEKYTVDIIRPILKWTHEEVFAYNSDHFSPSCKLYQMGMSRVGCFPCVNASLNEILQIALNFPEVIEAIYQLELLVGSTFFAPGTIPSKYCSLIREVPVYPEHLVKFFGKMSGKTRNKKASRQSQTETLFVSEAVADPEKLLYNLYFKNDKITVHIDDDGDEYIFRRVRCSTVKDVANYVVKNPDQAKLFTTGGGVCKCL